MSHFSTIDIEIRDIDALAAACAELDLKLVRDAEARGFGSQRQKAPFVIKLKGPYDVAVIHRGDGVYTFSADRWQGRVEKETGKDFGLLKQLYGVHRAVGQARAKGFSVHRRRLTNGTVRLTLSRT